MVAAGCRGARTAAPVPLIVDTDLSSDDLIALSVVARDPQIRLQAVTVSGTGLVEWPAGARLASSLLSALGQPRVPVACGRTLPLSLVHILPAGWRDAADQMFGLELPAGATAPSGSAASLLQRTIDKANRPPTVLELAPMTNLGQLLRQRPALAAKIHEIVAMGGAVSVPGNAPEHKTAETNIWLDPAAANVVLQSGAPVTLVPLDASNDVPVTASVAETLKRYHFEAPAATIAWGRDSRHRDGPGRPVLLGSTRGARRHPSGTPAHLTDAADGSPARRRKRPHHDRRRRCHRPRDAEARRRAAGHLRCDAA